MFSIVLRMAGLAARNSGKPPMKRVDVISLLGDFFVTILAGAITEAVNWDMAVRAIVRKFRVR